MSVFGHQRPVDTHAKSRFRAHIFLQPRGSRLRRRSNVGQAPFKTGCYMVFACLLPPRSVSLVYDVFRHRLFNGYATAIPLGPRTRDVTRCIFCGVDTWICVLAHVARWSVKAPEDWDFGSRPATCATRCTPHAHVAQPYRRKPTEHLLSISDVSSRLQYRDG